MKFYVFDCGGIWLDEEVLVVGINAVTASEPNKPSRLVRSPVSVYLIEQCGYVLYDAGMHESGMMTDSVDSTPDCFLPKRLEQLGISPEQITHVVVSHLHGDHAGYLYLFKNAEIIVNDDEFTQSVKNYALRRRVGGPYMAQDFDRFLDADLNWTLLENDVLEYPLMDGVTVVNFGSGHSFGVLGLLAELPNSGPHFFVSDALYTELNAGPPVRLPGIVWDSLGYRKTAKFIQTYAKNHNAKIIYGHNIEQVKNLIKSTEGYYD